MWILDTYADYVKLCRFNHYCPYIFTDGYFWIRSDSTPTTVPDNTFITVSFDSLPLAHSIFWTSIKFAFHYDNFFVFGFMVR